MNIYYLLGVYIEKGSVVFLSLGDFVVLDFLKVIKLPPNNTYINIQ